MKKYVNRREEVQLDLHSLLFHLQSSIFTLLSPLFSFRFSLFPLPTCTSTKIERGSGIGDNRDKYIQREEKRKHDDDVANMRYWSSIESYVYGTLHACRNKGLRTSWGTFANNSPSSQTRDPQNTFFFLGGEWELVLEIVKIFAN